MAELHCEIARDGLETRLLNSILCLHIYQAYVEERLHLLIRMLILYAYVVSVKTRLKRLKSILKNVQVGHGETLNCYTYIISKAIH